MNGIKNLASIIVPDFSLLCFFIPLYDKDYFLSNEYTPYPSGSKPPIKAQVAQPINP